MLWTSSQTTLAKYPRFVAEFLNRDPTCFTGNCWRRRELLETDRATILAENGKNKKLQIASRLTLFQDQLHLPEE
jgi:hypothetical protein